MKYTTAAKRTLERLPQFSQIDTASLASRLGALIDQHRARIAELTADPATITWDQLIEPMEAMADEIRALFAPASHLHNVADSDDLREAYGECVGLLSAYQSEVAQNRALCDCYQTLHDAAEFANRSEAERALISNGLRDFLLGGVALDDDKKAAVTELAIALAQLGTQFEENLLDATQQFKIRLPDDSRLAGLPKAIVALAEQNANDDDAAFILTLDFPCYLPAMQHLHDRDLREQLYRGFVTRASELDASEHDNSEVMRAIVGKRQDYARALGFDDYSSLSLATKMAPSTGAVIDFLTELAARAKPAATTELADLTAFAKETLGMAELAPWDIPYCSERYREHLFNFSQEELRPYFPVARVIDGLFKVAATLFGVRFEAVDQAIDRWHEDVQFFAIADANDEPIGFFYLDLYARAQKRSGAWMDECLVRWSHGGNTQLPVAYLTCNFTPPVDQRPTLLTHDDVITLFHEFGHGLHHLLTKIERPAVAGINGVAWDAVELPSQILENWAWEREAVDLISGHYENEEPLPDGLYQNVIAAKNFQAAMQTLRQVEFALFDFRLHAEFDADTDIQALLDDVRSQVAVVPVADFNRFQHSFSHIFAGGYAAGYYSYKWAEVLAADAFARFQQEGIFNPQTGLAFRQAILERGGSEDAMTLFKRFRGREPSVDALLRQAGLIDS